MVVSTGIDIVDIARVRKIAAEHGEKLKNRVFTEEEIAYCDSRPNPERHFAGKWAAKEAVVKALGTGWAHEVLYKNIEIINDSYGKPVVRLNGKAETISRTKSIDRISISIAHEDAFAVAVAVGIAMD